jgi:uncharacterized protein (TIGR02594 family)
MSIFRRGTLEVKKPETQIENVSPVKLPSSESGPGNGWVPTWEIGHANRSEWTKQLQFMIGGEFFGVYDSASDVEKIHPKYRSMTKSDRLKVWTEFFSAVASFESSWIPWEEEPDVGTKENKNTWSVGLFQLSQVDQTNYGINLGYSYEDLKDPLKNINLAVRIMAKQIAKRGKVFIPVGEPGVYWAVIHPGGKYDKTAKIQAIVAKVPFEDVFARDIKEDDITPWMTIANRELGQHEVTGSGNNPRIVEYHKATTLAASEDEVPWCSAFVSWCLQQANMKSTRNAWARSYCSYGTKADKPRYGCVVVLERGTDAGHVGFYLDETTDAVYLLGGNQGDAVTKQWFAKSRVLAYRWPVPIQKEIPMAFV